ncbi:24313_t:CDS:2 [Gigaspora margarita]|uniref:24313_t:CDS:1 n=1 Tax=Gigaspora margarita TaxID=4874 RepID=A0ABN7W5J6_GIGMA|nr:24313_t:CDS:2 [Gigaspora margarita]
MRKKGKRRLMFELEKVTDYGQRMEHYTKQYNKSRTNLSINEKKMAELLKTEDTNKTNILKLLRKCIRKLDTFCCRIRKRVLIPQEEKELHKLYKDIEKNYEINTLCEQAQDIERKRYDLENVWKLLRKKCKSDITNTKKKLKKESKKDIA